MAGPHVSRRPPLRYGGPVAEDVWRIDEGGERDDAPAGTRRAVWSLASWSGDRRAEVEVVWPEWLEEVAEAIPGVVGETLADPPGRRGLRAVLPYLAAEHPPARLELGEEGVVTRPRWIALGAAADAGAAAGRAWLWDFQGPQGRVVVRVEEGAGVSGSGRLPKDVRDARSSRGLSVLAPLLDRPVLPERVVIGVDGVLAEGAAGPAGAEG